jgi:glyceraldehyde 3-phosphate dehydrogenase
MGFGRVGRELYRLAASAPAIEVVAVADLATADVLRYLLAQEGPSELGFELDGNFLQAGSTRTRMLRVSHPHEVPWDAFGVELVVEATGRYQKGEELAAHLHNGAARVLLAGLPDDGVDRLIIPGINETDAALEDRIVCAGSGTTAAFALTANTLDKAFGVEHVSMTTIHAFTSDQPAQDYPGADCRRSRSAAKNIIPNATDSPRWVAAVLPHLDGKLSGYALNVPVQKGSLLDVTAILRAENVSVEDVNDTFREKASNDPHLIKMADDPIVSSDVIDETCSLTIDSQATLRSGAHMIKVLGWYDARGHAARLLDVIGLYRQLDLQVQA